MGRQPEMVEENLIRAMSQGTAQGDSARTLLRTARASRNITIRLAEADLALPRRQAEDKGLPYQTPFDPRFEVSADAVYIAKKVVTNLWVIFVLLPIVLVVLLFMFGIPR